MPWSEMMTAALYGPGGFYALGGGAGRDRDFVTSPELGLLFGAVVAHAIDGEWQRCGRPDPWMVVEGGAGSGALAAAVLAAEPACRTSLRYLAVEASPALRQAIGTRIDLEDATQVLGPHAPPDPDDAAPGTLPGQGPLVATLAELPVGTFPGMVIANELLDNLPFDVYERSSTGWNEVRVGWSDTPGPADPSIVGAATPGPADPSIVGAATPVEVLVPADPSVVGELNRLAPGAPVGARVPWQREARRWISRACELLDQGSVIAFDYGRTTEAMAAEGGWLRTYRRGGRGGAPLTGLGRQDITADVAIDQFGRGAAPTRVSSQAEWLSRHGIDDHRARAAADWTERAATGDLAALRARSRVSEADALCDPNGLGGFVVLEWEANHQRS